MFRSQTAAVAFSSHCPSPLQTVNKHIGVYCQGVYYLNFIGVSLGCAASNHLWVHLIVFIFIYYLFKIISDVVLKQ